LIAPADRSQVAYEQLEYLIEHRARIPKQRYGRCERGRTCSECARYYQVMRLLLAPFLTHLKAKAA
jgi:hypothetical protein